MHIVLQDFSHILPLREALKRGFVAQKGSLHKPRAETETLLDGAFRAVATGLAGGGVERDGAENINQIELRDQIDGALAKGFQIPAQDPVVHRRHAVAVGVPARRGFVRLRVLLLVFQECDYVFLSDGIRMGLLAGIFAGDLAASQETSCGLFADVAELVKLLHGQFVGDFAPVDVVHSNTPQKRFVGVRTCLCIAFWM